MHKQILFLLIPSVLSSFLSPASAFEELEVVSLKPMEKPSPLPMAAGTEQHWLKEVGQLRESIKHGKEYIIYYESADSEKYRMRDSDGCSWTRMTGMFAPTLEFYDCRQGRSGTQEIIKSMGNPWPLSEKTEFQYEFSGKWDDGFGALCHSTRECKVDKQVRVKVPAGEFDTYKLVCQDSWGKWTYWQRESLPMRSVTRKITGCQTVSAVCRL